MLEYLSIAKKRPSDICSCRFALRLQIEKQWSPQAKWVNLQLKQSLCDPQRSAQPALDLSPVISTHAQSQSTTVPPHPSGRRTLTKLSALLSGNLRTSKTSLQI
jgi:hypothetical protein